MRPTEKSSNAPILPGEYQREWFGHESERSKQLLREEWCPGGIKRLEEGISALIEVRSPSSDVTSRGRGRVKLTAVMTWT